MADSGGERPDGATITGSRHAHLTLVVQSASSACSHHVDRIRERAGGTATAAGQAPQGRGGGPGRGGRGTPIKPGEECPPGTTEIRPDRCQAPEMPAPSILDYRPHSTLVSADHLVPKAKFPAIDYHGHPRNLIASAEGLNTLIAAMDSLNLRRDGQRRQLSGDRLTRTLEVIRNSPHRDRVRVLTGVNLSGVGPGWAEKAIAQLEADLKAGAVGIGEIGKGFGLRTRKADGSRLQLDDPDARSVLGGVRPTQASGLHPHRRSRGVLPADRLSQRALAGARAVRRSALPGQRVSAVRSS